MTRTPLLLALAATVALAGCNKEDHTIVAGVPGDNATADVNLADVQLPPSISSSKTYRCKDNSVVRIDWLSDGTARAHPGGKTVGTPVEVGAGKPIQGTPEGSSVTYNGQGCAA